MPKANFQKLTQQIIDEAVKEAKGKIPPEVCQAWPDAKKVLQDLHDAIKNVWAKLVISIVIGVGDNLCTSRRRR